MLKILFFASLREMLGKSSEEVELPVQVANVDSLLDWLAARGGEWERLKSVKNLRCAVNQEMARPDTLIKAGDEVAFFPPVTGG